MAIYDANDNILMRFQYADSRLPVNMHSGGATYYLAYDQVGSLRIVTDASGNVIKTLDYDSFGNIIQDTNHGFYMPFGFAGGLYDQDTGLIRFGFREYSPEIGRWTAKDPILFMGGDTDIYGYCLSDPINWVDPGGLFAYGSYDQTTGNLYLYDPATGLEVSAEFFSGGKAGDPIPNGNYDIIEHGGRSDFYRLEPVDSPYGDDINQRTGRNEFRLHKPGGSIGCLTAKSWADWNKIKKFLEATDPCFVTVPSKYKNPIKKLRNPTEKLPWYGRLTVIGSN